MSTTEFYADIHFTNGSAVAIAKLTWQEAVTYARKMSRKNHVERTFAYDCKEDYLKEF